MAARDYPKQTYQCLPEPGWIATLRRDQAEQQGRGQTPRHRIRWGIMKEFKLSAWPDLPAAYQRSSHRRMVSDMSHRYVTVQQLVASAGVSKMEVRVFLQVLADRGLLIERSIPRESLLRPLGSWLRRALQGDPAADSRGR
jgi:hypothetical protein